MSIVTQNNQNLKKMKKLKKVSLSLATKELSRKELKGIMAGNEELLSLDSLDSLEAACPRTSRCSSGRGKRHGDGHYTCC